ncbi:hypothetical protein PILCRDRAFT_267705 [Piloderma croceum F 1598]|uniref:Uncharacterized protein n=1 Tax=Piloderma croceum (strain F 1598) TaxID=765440 RepID=A0A0C3G8A6_PILCF|nr:hypothetical protein PILCRDRAFT_267705 [Piloderma croceum F 1598]
MAHSGEFCFALFEVSNCLRLVEHIVYEFDGMKLCEMELRNIYYLKVSKVCVRARPLGRFCEETMVSSPSTEDGIGGEDLWMEVIVGGARLCEAMVYGVLESESWASASTPPECDHSSPASVESTASEETSDISMSICCE